MDLKSKVVERLIKYAKVYTTSDEESETIPSTKRQFDLAHMLVDELKSMGLEAEVDEHGYVYSELKGNVEGEPTIGLIAHMDTAPDMSGQNYHDSMIL